MVANANLKSLGTSPTQPYQHAAKLFLSDTFRLSPKNSFLYYVVINFDPSLTDGNNILSNIINFAERYQRFETGMLVKKSDLPKFQIQNKTLNAYNRKNILTTSISYEPVTLTFHDDSADVITNFWNDYYTYYFRDSDYDSISYRHTNRYSLRNKLGWGFGPRNQSLPPLLSNIRLFSLHNKRFTEYQLVNPIITAWRHGELNSSDSVGILENSMTVQYETVKYFTGYIDPVVVDGFTLLHYDTRPSPIAKSTNEVYSSSGILGVIDGSVTDLRKPDGEFGAEGVIGNLLTLYRTYNNLKNTDFKNAVGVSLTQIGARTANQLLNSATPFIFPTASASRSSQVVNSIPRALTAPVITGISGGSISLPTNSNINSGSNPIEKIVSEVNRGVRTSIDLVTTPVRTVFDVVSSQGIRVNPSSLNVATGTITAVILDDFGQPVSQFTTLGTQSGTYNPNNINENLRSVQTTYAEDNTPIYIRTYADGTQVVSDRNENVLGLVPGNLQNKNNVNTNPVDTRVQVQNGVAINSAGIQYRTDPRTGLVYTVGGTTSAQIANTISGTAGAATGLVTGQAVGSALNRTFLGKSAIGRTVSSAIATTTGAAVGRAVNNGLQPIVNNVTGKIVQGWDVVAKEIRNVVGEWTGTGGYNPSDPTVNSVNQIKDFDDNGNLSSTTTFYKDGSIVQKINEVDEEGNPYEREVVTLGNNNKGTSGFFNLQLGQNTDNAATYDASYIPFNITTEEIYRENGIYDTSDQIGIQEIYPLGLGPSDGSYDDWYPSSGDEW